MNFFGRSFNCTDVQLNANPNPTELLAYLTHPCVYDKYTSPLHSLFKHQPDVIHVRMHIYYIKHKPAQDLVICFIRFATVFN